MLQVCSQETADDAGHTDHMPSDDLSVHLVKIQMDLDSFQIRYPICL